MAHDAALEQLVEKIMKDGPISVEDARALADMARVNGVPIDQMPKASPVADPLRAKGMTPAEIKIIEGTLGKDGETSMTGTKDDVVGPHQNVDGKPSAEGNVGAVELATLAELKTVAP